MTTQAVTTTSNDTGVAPGPAKPKRRKVEHLFNARTLVFAEQHQLSCKTLCGVWKAPNGGKLSTLESRADLTSKDCARCIAAFIKHYPAGRS